MILMGKMDLQYPGSVPLFSASEKKTSEKSCPQTRLGCDSNTELDMTIQPGPVDILVLVGLPNNRRTLD